MLLFGMLLIERGASKEVLPFKTHPVHVHTYFIRSPAAEYATQKPYGEFVESLACKTINFHCLGFDCILQ